MLKTVISRVLSSALLILFLGGCYSLGGGSLPEHIKTVAVPVFAGGYGYGNDLNRAVTNKIEAVTPLQITSSIARADALLECSITTWSDSSSQLSVDTERAITNRITIGVKASMDDRVEKEQMFFTVVCCFCRLHSGRLSWSAGGHTGLYGAYCRSNY